MKCFNIPLMESASPYLVVRSQTDSGEMAG